MQFGSVAIGQEASVHVRALRFFFASTSYRHKAERWRCFHCVNLVHTYRLTFILTFFGHQLRLNLALKEGGGEVVNPKLFYVQSEVILAYPLHHQFPALPWSFNSRSPKVRDPGVTFKGNFGNFVVLPKPWWMTEWLETHKLWWDLTNKPCDVMSVTSTYRILDVCALGHVLWPQHHL